MKKLTGKIDKLVQKFEKKSKTLELAISIPELELSYEHRGVTKFHSASVGKLMTAALVFKAVENGLLSLDSFVADILGENILNGLFVFQGVDYAGEVRVEDLLGHTSGINDYFEGSSIDGSSFISMVIAEPDRFFYPRDLLEYTRSKQAAVGKPGESFFYSDTGYVLLGLLIEKLYNRPFDKVLDEYIFIPAKMEDSTLCFYGQGFKAQELAPLFVAGVDVHLFRSLSCDFSGGGLSLTAVDLVKFMKFLFGGFLSGASLARMERFNNRFRQGLWYGLGLMEVRFEEFFFLLKGWPRLRGHIGITGVHAWFDPVSGDVYVLNVGDTRAMVKSFRLLISVMQLVIGAKKKSRD